MGDRRMRVVVCDDDYEDVAEVVRVMRESGLIDVVVLDDYSTMRPADDGGLPDVLRDAELCILDVLISPKGNSGKGGGAGDDFMSCVRMIAGRIPFIVFSSQEETGPVDEQNMSELASIVFAHGGIDVIRKNYGGDRRASEARLLSAVFTYFWSRVRVKVLVYPPLRDWM